MGYNWGYYTVNGFGSFGFLLWLAIFVDLLLLGVWLTQQILRK